MVQISDERVAPIRDHIKSKSEYISSKHVIHGDQHHSFSDPKLPPLNTRRQSSMPAAAVLLFDNSEIQQETHGGSNQRVTKLEEINNSNLITNYSRLGECNAMNSPYLPTSLHTMNFCKMEFNHSLSNEIINSASNYNNTTKKELNPIDNTIGEVRESFRQLTSHSQISDSDILSVSINGQAIVKKPRTPIPLNQYKATFESRQKVKRIPAKVGSSFMEKRSNSEHWVSNKRAMRMFSYSDYNSFSHRKLKKMNTSLAEISWDIASSQHVDPSLYLKLRVGKHENQQPIPDSQL